MIVYQQATTGKLHRRRSCSITSRTRYDHFPVEFTDELATSCPRCAKCWDGFTPAKQSDEPAAPIVDPPATTEEAIARAAVKQAGPVQSHAGETELEWRYSLIDGGGEKWSLRRVTGDYVVPVATLVRLPGSKTRIYRYEGSGSEPGSFTDHPAPCEARLALIDELGVELPRLPGRSDEAHSRAISFRRIGSAA